MELETIKTIANVIIYVLITLIIIMLSIYFAYIIKKKVNKK